MNYSDGDIREWAYMASINGGRFVKSIAAALLAADDQNFALLRVVAVALIDKYPKYLEWARKEAENERMA